MRAPRGLVDLCQAAGAVRGLRVEARRIVVRRPSWWELDAMRQMLLGPQPTRHSGGGGGTQHQGDERLYLG